MNQVLFRTGAIAGALVFLAFAAHAAAGVSAMSNSVTPLVIPVIDEETLAVEEDLRPDLVQPGSQEEPGPGNAPMEAESNGQGAEERELQREQE